MALQDVLDGISLLTGHMVATLFPYRDVWRQPARPEDGCWDIRRTGGSRISV
jgi:hypothetical protein